MGWILSKFRRKRSTLEELEKLEEELSSLGKLKTETLVWQKKVLGHLVTYSILAYLLAALLVYFHFLPSARDRSHQLVLLLPFLVTPLLIYILRRCLTWWYHRKVSKGDAKLAGLRERKAKILEEVMEKETYKVAKQILDKFAPSKLQSQLTPPRPLGGQPPQRPGSVGGMEVRRRPQALNSSAPLQALSATPGPRTPATPTPLLARPAPGPLGRGGPGAGGLGGVPVGAPGMGGPGMGGPGMGGPVMGGPVMGGPRGGPAGRGGPPGPPLPRPVMPRERGYLDKFVEYLVGDGPANRFALICRQCQSHNGMALREEFEYVAYRCCYCYYWNPARKQRPVAPRLPEAATLPQSGASTDSSDEESGEEEGRREEQERSRDGGRSEEGEGSSGEVGEVLKGIEETKGAEEEKVDEEAPSGVEAASDAQDANQNNPEVEETVVEEEEISARTGAWWSGVTRPPPTRRPWRAWRRRRWCRLGRRRWIRIERGRESRGLGRHTGCRCSIFGGFPRNRY